MCVWCRGGETGREGWGAEVRRGERASERKGGNEMDSVCLCIFLCVCVYVIEEHVRA